MHILYLHQHFSTPAGSTGIRSYEMARALLARGHKVTMLCGSYRGAVTGLGGEFVRGVRRGQVDGIEVVEIDCAYANAMGFTQRAMVFLKFALKSTRIALTENYDLVFATTTPLTAGIPAIVARWLRGKRFVFEVRDLWPELPKAMGVITNPVVLWAMGVLEWVSYRSAHRLIGLSPGMVEGIARLGVTRERIAMIPNGCDMELFNEAGEAWRPEGVAEDVLMAVYAGTHGRANGLDAVLDAAAVLKAHGRDDIRIVLIGDGKLRPELMARAEREGLNNVLFLPPVNKAKLAGLMKATDVGLQLLANVPAFYYGTSPNKFFDYLASGVPPLTNYPGWVAELITNNQCGFAVPPATPLAFANALEQAANDRAMLRKMASNARALATKEFTRSTLAAQFADWLEGAMKA
jgi:glycosyltransferase involved in cell wall biosynthesis